MSAPDDPDYAERGLREFESYLDKMARFKDWVREHGTPHPAEPSDEEWREAKRHLTDDNEDADADA